ncbi:phage tail protein [Salisaeta longa]|uniref:phage tail protein n=1 Tax=Salisaeta longa TaxID=503170 RepID=UPI00389ADA5A
MWGLTFAPRMFANCDGQLMPISQNQALFALIGTTYGGDGRTTFALPDLRGRVPVHAGHGPGLSPYPQGQRGGTESKTLSVSNLPPHSHAGTIKPNCASSEGNSSSPTDNYPATGAGGRGSKPQIYADGENAEMGPTPFTTGPTGSGIAFDQRQPFLTVRFCIAMTGIFPSRN